MGSQRSRHGLATAAALFAIAFVAASCGSSAAGSSPQASGSPSPARPSASPSPSATAASPGESPVDIVDFEINGSIGGKQVSGKLSNGAFSVPCSGAGADQVLAVHWTGTVGTTGLQGEIDFKPGSWTLGSSSAQGVATVGELGGKPADSLAAVSGTVTTQPSGGSINATFANGPGSLQVSGTWTCPSAGAS